MSTESGATAVSLSNLQSLLGEFVGAYSRRTHKRLKIMDLFCLFCAVLITIPFGYAALVGKFPYNSMLSACFAPLGALILTVCLRFQIDKESKYANITEQKAFYEYLFSIITFFFAIINFLG
mmetsp:Transcript_52748/g.60623  ORF Transcript_52748/g.60623 Transcript_52748/m.60623 type:complete len:122 (+) Transcript_52748:16-381(+)